MEKVVNKTVDVLTRFGERIERRLSTGDDDEVSSAFQRPLDGNSYYSSSNRNLIYGRARNSSSDNLAANPGVFYGYNNYGANPRMNPYGAGMMSHPYGVGMAGSMNYGHSGQYAGGMMSHGNGVGGNSVGYSPDYYVAERRQIELVPAPPPRYIKQPVPVPVPIDRPVPQPYPVEVPRPVHVDRPVPVPVPVPTPVPVDRPVPVPVPVPVPSPPPQQIAVPVPVPVPSPVPCYIPVGIPVPSPPPSPVLVENSVIHTQRWITGSPVMMNHQRYMAGSPVMGMNPCASYIHGNYIR